MIKNLLLYFFFAISLTGFSQVEKHVSWKYTLSNPELKVGETVDLIFTASIDKDWYLYSSDFDPNLGPTVTTFEFKPDPSYSLVGKVKATKPKKKFDDIWGGEYTYFISKGEFKQSIKVLKTTPKIIGSVHYQTCTEKDGKCIGGDDDFSFRDKIKLASAPTETIPQDTVKKKINEVVLDTSITSRVETQNPAKRLTIITKKIEEEGKSQDQDSLITFMLLAFGAGLISLLTPCVFPMIPMTVTFFTNSSNNRGQAIKKAVTYGVSIIFIYSLIGFLLAKINGPEVANLLSTHWIPNLFFFLTFLIFALSFLGLFEITLPSSFVNKVDSKADQGGLAGVFFMAFTLVLVSFSCTGPIVGTILVEAAGGQALKPLLGMLSYSFAFAIPFTLFALFPSWLNKLPRSGGWLNVIKVTLGFVELALAFKFLSIADQVYHWDLLDREIYIAIWIIIAIMLGVYLLGKMRLPHDSETHITTVPRLMLAIIAFTFALYLLPGMFGAPLKALSGYLPPMSTHDFDLPSIIRMSDASIDKDRKALCDEPKYSKKLHLPHGLKGYFDYQQALNCARERNMPLFIDFTGHGCVNCREMEANVWSDPDVLKSLNNDFILVALYSDDPSKVDTA
ncbi:MAG TPA: cytochrome c biogenesis protein CcdA, partial [Cytophagaceae bacterium]